MKKKKVKYIVGFKGCELCNEFQFIYEETKPKDFKKETFLEIRIEEMQSSYIADTNDIEL